MRQGVLWLGRDGPSVPVLGRLTGPLRFCCVCGSPRVLSARPPRPRGAVDGPEWVSPGGGPAAPRRCPARGFASSPPGEAGGSGVMPRGRPAPERLARTRGPSASSFPMTCPGFVQLTLTPAQQQLLLQQAQAQAQLLAAAVQQHSASQQHSAAGATISASAATPMTQIPLSQPIQIAQVSERAPRGAPWSLLPRPRNNTVVCLFESRS